MKLITKKLNHCAYTFIFSLLNNICIYFKIHAFVLLLFAFFVLTLFFFFSIIGHESNERTAHELKVKIVQCVRHQHGKQCAAPVG